MTTNELSRRTRTTLRAIQWWCDTGILPCDFPERSRREFDESQALTAAIIAELRNKGVTLQRIRKLPISRQEGDYLLTDRNGKSCRWCTEQELIPCAAACPGSCLVVSLKDLRARLNGDPSKGRKAAS